MPATGTSVARIEVARLKNSTAPLRTWPQEIRIGAELIGRKQLEFNAAGGLFLDPVERFLRPLIDGMRRILAGRVFIEELGGIAAGA